jgi:hypothetical protein
MRLVAVGADSFGVFAVGQQATGFFALGQEATGVVAIGQLATGVVAVGQLARGAIVVGQLAVGLACAGQVAVGVLWCAGMGVGGTRGPGLVYGFFGRPTMGKLMAIVRRTPRDRVPRRPWRLAVGVVGTAGLAVAWWYITGHAVASLLS